MSHRDGATPLEVGLASDSGSSMTTWLGYFCRLVEHSWHGTLKYLEPAEALLATLMYALTYFVPEWHEFFLVGFVIVGCAFVLTFLFGIVHAAYHFHRQLEDRLAKVEEAERRRRAEPTEEERAFAELEKEVPDLLDDLQKHLAENRLLRDILLVESKNLTVGWDEDALIYYLDEEPNTRSKVRVLQEQGMVTVLKRGWAFQMTERFARYLKNRASK